MRRTIVILAFTAEEKGLLGSRYFSEHPFVEMDKISAALNIDMIGTKQLFGSTNRQFFGNVYPFATAIVAASWVAFRVLVRQNGALRFQDCIRHEVL